MITLIFSLPAILLAQRWDKMVTFPVPSTFVGVSLTDVTTGPDGALWYTDSLRNVVGRMTTAGAITEYSVCCDLQGITSGPDGALWFALDGAIGRITTGGVFTSTPLPTGSQVIGITPGPDGALWFTEGACCGFGNRIGRITTSGVITEFEQLVDSSPSGIVAGPDGALWFTEQSGNRIGRITTSGFIEEFPAPTCCGPLSYITAGRDGALWFTETDANQIGRITTRGVITEFPLPNANSQPFGITRGPDGAVWFTELGGPRIGRITAPLPTSTGDVIVEYSLPTNDIAPGAITAGPDGHLWFTELIANPSTGNRTEALGQAAACALGLSVTYVNSDLEMAFTLGTSQPSVFSTYLIEGATVKHLWSQAIPAFDPPRSFTRTVMNFPRSGSVAVFSTIGTASSGMTCYDLELVDTGAGAATPTALEQAWRTIVESGILQKVAEP